MSFEADAVRPLNDGCEACEAVLAGTRLLSPRPTQSASASGYVQQEPWRPAHGRWWSLGVLADDVILSLCWEEPPDAKNRCNVAHRFVITLSDAHARS